MKDIFISVIIPAYNTSRYISEAIESILQQTVPPQEIVVVDDGSTDETDLVVKKFGGIVRYVFQENGGIPVARNKGLELARGNLISFIDADDIWLKNKLELQLQLFQKNPQIDIAIGFLQFVNKSSMEDLIINFNSDDEGFFVLSLGSTLIRRDVFERVGIFDENMTLSEDLDWFLRVREFGANVHVHEDLVQLYRQHENNVTKNRIRTNSYMLKAFKKSLERRRKSGDETSMDMPSFKNLDNILEFWKKNKREKND